METTNHVDHRSYDMVGCGIILKAEIARELAFAQKSKVELLPASDKKRP